MKSTMRNFSLLEPPSKEFIEIAIKKYGLDPSEFDSDVHPQEDFFIVSKKYPIFVVADGVTLIQYLIEKKGYPNPSPAGDIARIFCEELSKAAEAHYDSFGAEDIKEIFREANAATGIYNQNCGRTKETVDYWNTDFYAATAAFAVVKDNMVYWGSICDSFVIHFSNDGAIKFRSPDCNTKTEAEPPKFTGDKNDQRAKAQYTWHEKRNGINEKGELVGYGVVTGEEAANRYLNFGNFEVSQGDLIIILTDGFEDYIQLSEFISFFKKWPDDLELQFKKFTDEKTKEDPEKFGHERSLIVISI